MSQKEFNKFMDKTVDIILVIVVLLFLTISVFKFGYALGERNVLNNQIITSENEENGFYKSMYEDEEVYYYYCTIN